MTVYIANIDFEFELTHPTNLSLEESWLKRLHCLQLQFIPLLYAEEGDVVAVTSMPDQKDIERLEKSLGRALPSLVMLKEIAPFADQICYSWGPSLKIAAWAKERHMIYNIPEWSVIQQINSKAFSHTYTTLKEAALLHNKVELMCWIGSFEGPKVIKNCFGLSGSGHRFVNDQIDPLLAFCEKEWKAGRPVIGEPWLKRVFDFSTQWFLHSDGTIELLGSTVFETASNGTYLGTLAGDEKILFGGYWNYLEEHKVICRKMILDLFELGYYGHVGVDALLYESDGIKLYPIVEINGRQTLSLAALRLQKNHFMGKTITLVFSKDEAGMGLLPSHLGGRAFSKNLQIFRDFKDL